MAQIEKVTDVLTQVLSEGFEISFKLETVLGQEAVRVMVWLKEGERKVQTTKYIGVHELPYFATALDEIYHQVKTLKNELRSNS
jgi:hypothetical protein